MTNGSTERKVVTALAVALLLAAGTLAALFADERPVPLALDAPVASFSAARARLHLEAIATTPRRSGSAAHVEARQYLETTLRALGWEVSVQEASVLSTRYESPERGRPARAATVRNVIARRRGAAGGGGAVLLMAHYDTRSMTPGASDDGYGTATLLETARALTQDAPPAHDVILLFTDAEEEGLLGAQAFVSDSPIAKEARIVLNFEARGNSGPVLMFETTDGNADLVRALASVSPFPMGSSLARAIYKRMPNDTDFTRWLPTKVAGMNFANIEGLDRYHAPTDTAANVDLTTLQHHGSYALALARYYASQGELPGPASGADVAFFNLGPLFVRYPLAWAVPIAAVAVLVFLVFVVAGVRRGAISRGGALAGLGFAIASTMAAGLACAGAWAALTNAEPDYELMNAASPALKVRLAWAAIGLAITLILALAALVSRAASPTELAFGGGVVWAVLAVTSAVLLPEAAYLFAWPLLVSSAIWLFVVGKKTPGAETAFALAALAPLALLVPLAQQLFVVFGPGAAPGLGVVIALAATLAAPALASLLAPDRRAAPLLALAATVLLFVSAAVTPAFDPRNPRPDTVFAAVDADASTALAVSPSRRPDAWSARVFAEGAKQSDLAPFFPLGARPSTLSVIEQPFEPRPTARVEVVEDHRDDALPTLTVRVLPPEGAEVLAIYADATVPFTRAELQGKELPLLKAGSVAVYYTAPPATGVRLTVALGARSSVNFRTVAQEPGFPAALGTALGTRPPELMPKSGTLPPVDELEESDMTLVAHQQVL